MHYDCKSDYFDHCNFDYFNHFNVDYFDHCNTDYFDKDNIEKQVENVTKYKNPSEY